jgi:GNAT superfamily N-acetyltransferase
MLGIKKMASFRLIHHCSMWKRFTLFYPALNWAEGIPKVVVARAVEHSLCFGLYQDQAQIRYARVITDRASFAYLCDVYVLEAHRGKGLATWLMECVTSHPDLQDVRRFCLFAKDAHTLYARFGFTPAKNPDRYMEMFRPGIYQAAPE